MKKPGTDIWNVFEKILYFAVIKILHINLSCEAWEKHLQFVKFVLVGISNVIVSYGVYLVCLVVFQATGVLSGADYLVAQWIGYVLSIFWSFFWNRKYVFATDRDQIPWYKALLKSFASYSFTGIFLNSALAVLWVQIIGMPKIIAPIISIAINVPINFVLNKFWVFYEKNNKMDSC